jgi:hypothetical protein
MTRSPIRSNAKKLAQSFILIFAPSAPFFRCSCHLLELVHQIHSILDDDRFLSAQSSFGESRQDNLAQALILLQINRSDEVFRVTGRALEEYRVLVERQCATNRLREDVQHCILTGEPYLVGCDTSNVAVAFVDFADVTNEVAAHHRPYEPQACGSPKDRSWDFG